MPCRYNMNYKAWGQAFLEGGVILQHRQIALDCRQIASDCPCYYINKKLWWNLVDLESHDSIRSLATSALAAFLIFKQVTAPPVFSFPQLCILVNRLPIVQACLHHSRCARASIDWIANIIQSSTHPFFLKRNSKISTEPRTKNQEPRTRTKNTNRTRTPRTQNHTPIKPG